MLQSKLSVFAFISLFSLKGMAQQKVELKKGQKYQVESNTTLTSSAEVMGQTMNSSLEAKTITLYEVVNQDAASTHLNSTITRLKVSSTALEQETKFDSDEKDNEGPAAEALAGRVNKPKSVIIDSKGFITKQDEEEDGGVGMIDISLGNDNKIDLFVPILLTKELTAGHSFMDSVKVKKERYESNEVGTYKVTAVENGLASISYSGTQVVAAKMEQMGMEMMNNSTNDIKSEMQVDIKTRVVLSKNSVIKSTLSIEASGMTIPGTSKTIITLKISAVN